MSRSVSKDIDALQRRLGLLDDIARDGRGRLDDVVMARAVDLVAGAAARLGHGTSHTVVALAGATGSGKSSLCNAVTGLDVSPVGVLRPTTSESLAVVFGPGADSLLDWLSIGRRHRIEDSGLRGREDLAGLVLVDLPDHDSTESAHRREVDRLVEVVDVFVWVVDPQKYADAALHEHYIQRFSAHSATTLVVLNQIDRLEPAQRRACADDLARLLAADGLADVRVLTISAATGDGVPELRRELAARVAERRALVKRLDADIDWIAGDLSVAVGEGHRDRVPDRAIERLVAAATDAAGGREIEAAVTRAYRHRSALAVGWPVVRWLRHLRPDPLTRLGLGVREPTPAPRHSDTVAIRRTAIEPDPVALGLLQQALRDLGRDAGDGLREGPRRAIDTVLGEAQATLPGRLDAAAARSDLHMEPAAWWRIGGAVQLGAALALGTGLAWLAVLMVVGWLRLPDLPLPRLRGIAVPPLLVFGGLVTGLVMGVLGRRIAAIGARRRAARARRDLADGVAVVVDQAVVEPLNAELAVLGRLASSIRGLQR